MKETAIDLAKNQEQEFVPYLVSRKVFEQKEIETSTKYNRHKDTRKVIR